MTTLYRDRSGQALVELTLVLPLLLIFVLGIVDYGRAIYDMEVVTNLSGEGSSMASRGTSLGNTAIAVMADADVDMNSNGCVVVTSVASGATPGTYKVTGQATSAVCNGGSSRIGCFPPPATCGNANLPVGVQTVLQANANTTVYVTEVFYNFSAATPVGSFLTNSTLLPSQLYSVAFY